MKKILFLLIAAFILASCNDDCDHGFDGGGINSDILVGSWYEETQNEENTYSASSAFYGKYCNLLVQGEGQGTYRLDSERNRLTWSYHVNGMGMTSDWKLRNVTKYQFVQYSDVAILTYGKIIETYNMNGGDTQQITFNELNVQGYESTNENIATVSSSGLITATGEKGTVYIKVKCSEANVYVKVIVGDNYPDLWIDYSSLLGKDYAGMKNMLGDPDETNENNNGYSLYIYVTKLHNILRGLRISINSDTHKIDQVDLIIREGVPQEELLAYLNAHYYRLPGNFGTQYHYSTSPVLEESRAAYAYDAENHAVMIKGKEDYVDAMYCPWPNLSSTFGMNQSAVRTEMQKRKYTFYQSIDSYSFNGSDAYLITGSDGAYAVEFVFNPDNIVSQYWLYLSTHIDQAEVLKYLRSRYVEDTEEYVASYGFIFYNKEKTLKLVFKPFDNAMVCTDLTKTPVDLVILRDYWKGLGKTKNELVTLWGQPYYDYGDGKLAYAVVTDYIATVNFILNAKTERVKLINLFLREEVKPETIKTYLNRLYFFKEEVSSDNGPLLRWLNGKTEEESDMMISYYSDYGVVVYKPVVEEGTEPEPLLPNYEELVDKTPSEVKAVLGNPDRELAGSYVYSLTDHEFIQRLFVRFNDNPIQDTSVASTISVTLLANHDKEILLEYLKETYVASSTYSTSTMYVFLSKDGKVMISYSPDLNSISYMKSYGF